MKTFLQTSLKLALVPALLVLSSSAATYAQGAKLQLDQLDSLANTASETVDVRLDERLMQTTAKFFSGNDPDEAKVKELIKGVKGIYVRSFSFEKEGEYSQAQVDSITSQLRGSAWSKILTVRSRKQGDNVEVYLHTEAGQIGGLVMLSIDPKELTVVNIIGPIDLDKLSQLEGQFGVPELGIESKPKKNKEDK
jgi:hypothetical protein